MSILKALILIASSATPHSPKVLPSAAYMEVQSNATPSGLFIWSLVAFTAAAVTALSNSSVTNEVQFKVGETSKLVGLLLVKSILLVSYSIP